jgi:S1-C subfamily serine protease
MSKFWRHFISNGRGGFACDRLGFHGHTVPLFASLVSRLGLGLRSGVEVWRIKPGSPAHRAGLRHDDIILSVDDQPTANLAHLQKLLHPFPQGMPLSVVVLRDENLFQRRIVLDEPRPAEPRV